MLDFVFGHLQCLVSLPSFRSFPHGGSHLVIWWGWHPLAWLLFGCSLFTSSGSVLVGRLVYFDLVGSTLTFSFVLTAVPGFIFDKCVYWC